MMIKRIWFLNEKARHERCDMHYDLGTKILGMVRLHLY
jgi:hypothetical protein